MRGSIAPYKGKYGTSWKIVVDTGKDADGKRHQKRITFKGTRKEAERKLAEVITSIERGVYADPGRQTLADYIHRWIGHKAADLAPRTLDSYRLIMDLHLIPALGNIKLADLKPLHIQEYYRKALEDGRMDNKKNRKGLSPTTVLYHHRVLHEALEQAVRWQLLERNPAGAVTPPRKERREIAVLNSPEQARELLAAVRKSTLYIPTLLALYTGMRRGEILGLRWQDVDLKPKTKVKPVNSSEDEPKTAGSIQIRQTLQLDSDKKPGFFPPKTHRSRRSVAIPPAVADALRDHRKEQLTQRLRSEEVWTDNGLVICDCTGAPLHPDSFSARFREATKKLFGPPVSFHALRHTCASFLLALGCHPKVVAEQLGHSTTNLTLDTYSHVVPRLQSSAVTNLQEYLEGPEQV